jgi:alanyl-tRNA synthetase
MGFFGKVYDGIKRIGGKIKEGVKWIGSKLSPIYNKAKEMVENNPLLNEAWQKLRNIEIKGVSVGDALDKAKSLFTGAHNTIVDSKNAGDFLKRSAQLAGDMGGGGGVLAQAGLQTLSQTKDPREIASRIIRDPQQSLSIAKRLISGPVEGRIQAYRDLAT